jgi:hypothetical protein
VFASPLARRLAREAGLDLKTLKGTGPRGRIVRADVEAAGKGAPARSAPAVAAAPAQAVEPRKVQSLAQMGIPDGSYDLVPLDGMRKAIARRMTDSFRDVPHFPLTIDCEIDGLMAVRAKVNAMLEPQGIKVSVNDFVIKACALALKAVPEANASYSPEGLALHHHADIAMAVAIDGGLITPIIRKAELKSLSQIATGDVVDRIFIHLDRGMPPAHFAELGGRVVPVYSWFQAALVLVEAGRLTPQSALTVGEELLKARALTVTALANHVQDLLRRRLVSPSIGPRLEAAADETLADLAASCAVRAAWLGPIEGVAPPLRPAHIDYLSLLGRFGKKEEG